MSGVPLGFFTLGTAIGNTMGAIVCAFLLRRIAAFDNAMERTRDVVGYIGLACFLGTTVNAAFNVVSLVYAGAVAWPDLSPTVLEWWVPNALAVLVVAPFIIAWATPSAIRWNYKLISEAVICGAGLIAGTLISFHSWFVYGIQNYPLAYLPFPFLVWGALRFGQRGATTGTLLVSTLAIHSLLCGRGPFVTGTERESLMLIGSYIGVLAVTNMLLAAAAAERRQAERAVAESEKRFRAVVEDQTDLICRFGPDGALTFVNGAYCRFYGKSKDELLGTNFLATLCDQDLAIPLSYLGALPKEQPLLSFDQRVAGPNGRVVWQQYTVRRLFMDTGDTLEFQAVIQDVTQRKQTEQALRGSEEKYRSLVANIPGARLDGQREAGTPLHKRQCEKASRLRSWRTHPGRRTLTGWSASIPTTCQPSSSRTKGSSPTARSSMRNFVFAEETASGFGCLPARQPRKCARAFCAPTACFRKSRSGNGPRRPCNTPKTRRRPPTAPRANSWPI